MSDPAIVELIREKGYRYSEQPFTLASGALSHDFIDGKLAVASGADLLRVCQAMADGVRALGIDFTVVGGPTMGADAVAHGIAIAAGVDWFSVRKQPKGRGTNQWIEGARLGPDSRVLLVEDVISTGGSLLTALGHVSETGATVVAAATVVDRGESCGRSLAERDLPYLTLVTYADLGIVPIGG